MNEASHDSAASRALPVHEDVRHEDSEVHAGYILAVLAAIALVFIGVGIVCRWFIDWNERGAVRAPTAPRNHSLANELPPVPRLEPLDATEPTTANVFARQLEKERALHGYGQTAEDGFVHVPIERAMELAVETMPVRGQAETLPRKGFGLIGGGESNSGRLYSEAPSWLRSN